MAIAFDSAVDFSAEDQTTPTSVAAWTIAGSDRIAIASMLSRDFGTIGTHTVMRISGSGGSNMTQVGTTTTFGAAKSSVWSLASPGTGSSRVLYGEFSEEEAVAIIGAAVYTGALSSFRDTDTTSGSTSASTTITPGNGLTLTLTTSPGDVIVGLINITGSTPLTISSVTGVDATRTSEVQQVEFQIIVELAAGGGATTVIAPTVTFSGSNDTLFTFDAVVLQPAGGGGGSPTAVPMYYRRNVFFVV